MEPFRDIIGHRHVKTILLSSLKRGRVASTYLFAGDSGIGKRRVAMEFLQALNCKNSPEVCGVCSSCHKLLKGVHPDMLYLEPKEGIIRVSEVREIIAFLSHKPHEGRYKAVVIEDADKMNIEASNAFLKTLEEPPEKSLIILISMFPELLPETVRSRCFTLRFSSLSEKETLEVLRTHDMKDATPEVARLCQGRPGLVLNERESFESFEKVKRDITKGSVSKKWLSREEAIRWIDHALIIVGEEIRTIVKGSETEINTLLNFYNSLASLRKNLSYNLNLSIVYNYLNALLEQRPKFFS